ncbi:murein hydrolase activator EnvC family protein [Kordiimonas marina]|uniref:murein hydrolase activator EnvC family protein n=1 Tax=Kordiimonas marina TaxID=2872312 RepID=UPI001FF13D7F|nr:peptidoglycan DD-metalloendopeptidase family protein [Kordiimonas marina]MCJ9427880.1 peptidoglycan DD-metalloendopeptidase family protein [Kordiimonas marina]
MFRPLATALLAATLLSGGLQAQESPETAKAKLEKVQKAIADRKAEKKAQEQAAEAAKTAAQKLSEDLVAAAADIQQAEANVDLLEERVADLKKAVKAKKEKLEAHKGELLGLLAALERLSKRPVAFTFLQPQEALKTARSASLMSTLVPKINSRAAALKQELAGLAEIEANLTAEQASLKNNLASLTQHQQKLASLLETRKAEARKAGSEARKAQQDIARFARQAKSLKDLIDKLERQAAKERERAERAARLPLPQPHPVTPGAMPIYKAKGTLPYPAVGTVVEGFGVKDAAMGISKGIRIKARPGAQVVSPYDGQIVFAGPFLGYGKLLIISHGNGYHSLIAGLDEMYGVVGQWVLTGEPIGAMNKADDNPELYMELRHKGHAINPAPWLNRRTAAATQ